jgi:hypothetical protein
MSPRAPGATQPGDEPRRRGPLQNPLVPACIGALVLVGVLLWWLQARSARYQRDETEGA